MGTSSKKHIPGTYFLLNLPEKELGKCVLPRLQTEEAAKGALAAKRSKMKLKRFLLWAGPRAAVTPRTLPLLPVHPLPLPSLIGL